MHRAITTNDFMCPVKLAAAIVKHVLSYPGTSGESQLNLFIKSKGKQFEITSTSIHRDIKNAVKLIDPKILASSMTRLAPIPFVVEEPWLYTSLMYHLSQSWWLEGGKATPFYSISENKCNNTLLDYPIKCSNHKITLLPLTTEILLAHLPQPQLLQLKTNLMA